jgi:hypothetical protein
MANGGNDFCSLRNLRNESDVEQNFLIPLLHRLGFTEDFRKSKTFIPATKIGKGKHRRDYAPDSFVISTNSIPSRS